MKNKKLKKLILPLAVSALSLFGATGGTFAYFSSSASANVTIKTGTVYVSLALENLQTYSLDVLQPSGTFENGGTAELTEGTSLELLNITPGDKVEFDAVVTNLSNVAIKYKLYIGFGTERTGRQMGISYSSGDTITGTEYLSSGIKFSAEFEGNYERLDPTNPSDGTRTSHLVLELPKDAGNYYQGAYSPITIYLQAWQGNYDTPEEILLDGINNVLSTSNRVNTTMDEAVKELITENIDVTAVGENEYGEYLVWNQDTDRFALTNKYAPHTFKQWKIINSVDEIEKLDLSAYLSGTNYNGNIITSQGFDAGDNEGINLITYRHGTFSSARNGIMLRSAIDNATILTDLYVDPLNPSNKDVVYHYGPSGLIETF